MYSITHCMVCNESERTIVAEYNRLVFLDDMWQTDLARFDYALCHGCGLVYATRRPERKEYEYLYANFNEFLARAYNPNSLNIDELTPRHQEAIDRDFLRFFEIEALESVKLPVHRLLRQELANASKYVPEIAEHLSLRGAQVLQIRAKSGTLADYLTRLHGAERVDVMTLFPPHKYIAEKIDGVRAECSVDFENFTIPFDARYDIIFENHLFLHALDIEGLFTTFLNHLKPGGHLFVHKELSDREHFRKKKNLFAELRPFHFQYFDAPTVDRMLRRYGLRPVYLHSADGDAEVLGLFKLDGEPGTCPRIGATELRERLAMYAQWRDESILSLPSDRARALYGRTPRRKGVQGLFGDSELDRVWRRVGANGGLERDKKGRCAAMRPFREIDYPEGTLEIEKLRDVLKFSMGGRMKHRIRDGLRGTWAADRLIAALPETAIAHWLTPVPTSVAEPAKPAKSSKQSASSKKRPNATVKEKAKKAAKRERVG